MNRSQRARSRGTDITSPLRNNYFHGKMMDAYHFQLETHYHNHLRSMLNRLVIGRGVVCGLNVTHRQDCDGCEEPETPVIDIAHGVAIDAWGRPIVVPSDVKCLPIPKDRIIEALELTEEYGGAGTASRHVGHGPPGKDDDDDEKGPNGWVQVLIGYHECQVDPVPVLAGDCHGGQSCNAGTIREWYKFDFRAGRSQRIDLHCNIPDVVTRGRVNYDKIVDWVTIPDENELTGCRERPEASWLPLADVHFDLDESGDAPRFVIDRVDIYRRRVAYSNRLLFEMLLDLIQARRGPNR
ncbi:hypothetical protein DCC79_00385 [bacterium]|nr:hypothetical protein [Chloroflexi bacterium CFX6]RIL12720.1 MAG: hypothetical protein DCC79_00385 [bacterium]